MKFGVGFSSKTGAALATGGILGGGGAVIYNKTTPKNIQEALEWKGFLFIETIEDESQKQNSYRAVYLDNTGDISSINSGITGETDWQKIQTWCQTELKKPYVSEDFENKEKIIKYCEDKTPRTVEAHLKKIKPQASWIKNKETNSQDEPYKIIFAVYRYSDDFLSAINSVKEESEQDYSNTQDVSTGYTRLKTWCTVNLSKSVKEIEDLQKLYNHLTWWCQGLNYSTVQEKIKGDLPGWESEDVDASNADEENSNWSKIKGYWQQTPLVFKTIKSEASEGTSLKGSDYKKWCQENLSKKLSETGIYQEKHLVAKVVCVKEKVQKHLFQVSLVEAIERSKTASDKVA
ncbi:hypothetical protein [Candidatus Mycoplasma haematohominis]|uniref:Uncharacterized protein n=1 Tax=Candidatus Mycoplasma haematohominis TaxID=1494318 RepID=A0A478FQM9_9MOLU|nr:hypothetical protein [Candidatus Mycoplasma haemohominis]GCE63407.1 hypothetical protein MHSWG343_04030 [Candidatus Mycoplasma haemohominis]